MLLPLRCIFLHMALVLRGRSFTGLFVCALQGSFCAAMVLGHVTELVHLPGVLALSMLQPVNSKARRARPSR